MLANLPHAHDQPSPYIEQASKKKYLKNVYVSKFIDNNQVFKP